jgi:hypothetical protein
MNSGSARKNATPSRDPWKRGVGPPPGVRWNVGPGQHMTICGYVTPCQCSHTAVTMCVAHTAVTMWVAHSSVVTMWVAHNI